MFRTRVSRTEFNRLKAQMASALEQLDEAAEDRSKLRDHVYTEVAERLASLEGDAAASGVLLVTIRDAVANIVGATQAGVNAADTLQMRCNELLTRLDNHLDANCPDSD